MAGTPDLPALLAYQLAGAHQCCWQVCGARACQPTCQSTALCHKTHARTPPHPSCRCHVILANLRPAGAAKGYAIPRGFLFNLITCPNYTAEILGWVAFTVATQTAAAGLFTLVGAAQMAQWALGKHKRLLKVGLAGLGPRVGGGAGVCVL